jgi:transposase InsO family protein
VLHALLEQAARVALALRPPDLGLLHHADRGSSYTAPTYQELLARVRDRGKQEQLKRQQEQNHVFPCWLHPQRE